MSVMIDRINATGCDTEDALRRFLNNEALYEKFLIKFVGDTTYMQLEQCVSDRNYDEIIRSAHTLKGLSGNLGLTNIFTLADEIVTRLRANDYSNLDELYVKLSEKYHEVCEIICDRIKCL